MKIRIVLLFLAIFPLSALAQEQKMTAAEMASFKKVSTKSRKK
jgi:hypothetical protein